MPRSSSRLMRALPCVARGRGRRPGRAGRAGRGRARAAGSGGCGRDARPGRLMSRSSSCCQCFARAAVIGDGAVDVGAAPALVPARLRTPLGEASRSRRRVGDVAQRPARSARAATAGARPRMTPCRARCSARLARASARRGGGCRVAQRFRRGVEEVRRRGDVEAGRVAVARERGVAPFAVELVGAEHERAVDGGALGAVGGARVAVVEPAVARRSSSGSSTCARRDRAPRSACRGDPGQRAGRRR